MEFHYNWKVLEKGYIHDGDSFKDYTLDLGFNKRWEMRDLRLYGLDTPEVYKAIEKEAGLLVKQLIIDLHDLNPDSLIWIRSLKDGEHKYGEIMCEYYIDDFNLNEFLLKNKYAKPYFGGAKAKWAKSELRYIVQKLKK